MRWAVVEPTNPAPKTVTLRFMGVLTFELGSRPLLRKARAMSSRKTPELVCLALWGPRL